MANRIYSWGHFCRELFNFTADDEMEEVWELVWGEESVDFHDQNLVVAPESLEDHEPSRVVYLGQAEYFDIHWLEVRNVEQE